MEVKTKIRGIEAFQSFIRSVPRGTVKTALAAIADWYVGKDGRGLRHYEPYKYVKPFRSYSSNPEKAASQRRWIFAHLDQIGHNNRTGKTMEGWKWRETNGGYGINLENDEPGAGWLWGNKSQTRHNKAVGHRTIESKIASNYLGAIRHAVSAVKKFLKAKK